MQRATGLILLTLVWLAACEPAVDAVHGGDLGDVEANIAAASPLLMLADRDPARQLSAIDNVDRHWRPEYTPALLEYISLGLVPALQHRAMEVLRKRTGQDFGYDLNAWFSWVWRQELHHDGGYADFKSRLYRAIDPRFADYFNAERKAEIRLDEVRWGGVRQDGIPPLRSPRMLAAGDAEYLADTDIVFGLEVGESARAYPKRILAWHEMFVDTIEGVPVVGVYCTLCGSMILYDSVVDGHEHELGTSGFLYRSNKLMYDRATQSLWNTLWGTPVVGPLVGEGVRLPRRSVVTTTWGEWRRRHPNTEVLDLETGHSRDYAEGAAYREYFATDDLMFNTSQVDTRLANKAEVLGLVLPGENAEPLAIAAAYARANPLLHEKVGSQQIVVLTDASGAMRVYSANEVRFSSWDGDRGLTDGDGSRWRLTEDALTKSDGSVLPRLPSHSAFWFGWYGAYTNTRLLH